MVLLSIYFGVTFLAYCTYIYVWYVSPRPVISPLSGLLYCLLWPLLIPIIIFKIVD